MLDLRLLAQVQATGEGDFFDGDRRSAAGAGPAPQLGLPPLLGSALPVSGRIVSCRVLTSGALPWLRLTVTFFEASL